MSFWKSDRFEYFRQPHIIVIVIICLVVIVGAFYTGFRRITKISEQAAKPTEQKCLTYISDEHLCKFVANSETEGFNNNVSVTTTSGNNSLTITSIETETPDRIHSVTTNGSYELSEYVLYDDQGYIKDFTDGKWANYTDSEYAATEAGITYDFSAESTEDVIEFRDNYKRIGMEGCGDRNCHKYQIIDPEDDSLKTFVWFDDKDYLIRRYQMSDETSTQNTEYHYEEVNVEIPTDIKSVSEEELNALIEKL